MTKFELFKSLHQQSGIERISLSDFLFQKIYNEITPVLNKMKEKNRSGILFEGPVSNLSN